MKCTTLADLASWLALQNSFSYRIGLSATPVLQYNEAGTKAIADFFGETVFEFSLADAIGVCLVPYNYFLHPVPLAADEMVQWEELTEKLVRAGFVGQDEGFDGTSLRKSSLCSSSAGR